MDVSLVLGKVMVDMVLYLLAFKCPADTSPYLNAFPHVRPLWPWGLTSTLLRLFCTWGPACGRWGFRRHNDISPRARFVAFVLS